MAPTPQSGNPGGSSMNVSLYPKITVVKDGHNTTLDTILKGIKSGRWREAVEEVRVLSDKKKRTEAKKKVPYFTVSGTFKVRSMEGLIEHSGFACLDIDYDLSKMDQLKRDVFVYAVFKSISGAGLAVICKIPTDNHNASFRALKKYFEDDYGVKIDQLPDVSWPRFVSYDPELYLNPNSVVFEEQLEEEDLRPQPVTGSTFNYHVAVNSADYGQRGIANAVKMILDAADGEKHVKLNSASFLLGGYVAGGLISTYDAQHALEQAISQKANVHNIKDAFKVIERGIREGQTKPIVAPDLEYLVRTQKKNGMPKEALAHQVAASRGIPTAKAETIVEQIYAEQMPAIEKFWHVKYDEEKDKHTLTLSREKYLLFLHELGFRKFNAGKNYITVRVLQNIVHEAERKQIKDSVMEYLTALPFEFDEIYRSTLVEQILKEHKTYFDEGIMEFLGDVGNDFIRDTKTHAYFFFLNGFVEVTKNGIALKEYSELRGLIWKEQVIERTFTGLDSEEIESCDFAQFIQNVTANKINHNEKECEYSPERQASLTTAIGYLLHGYKAPSTPKIIILVDEQISENPNGGTGKGLIFQAVKRMQPTEILDGKNFDFKDKFAFQGITDATRLMVFEDWDGKRQPFDKLFNMATTVLKVNRLYQGQITIPYERSPKIGISTNDMIIGEGDSHARRKFEIEIAPYYSKDLTPMDEFGHEFFNDWDNEEWNRFDNLMLSCCQLYLIGGLKASKQVNVKRRKLLQTTSPEFVEFADSIERGAELSKKTLYSEFVAAYGPDTKFLTQVRFSRWLKTYAESENLMLNEWQDKNLGPTFNHTLFTLK